MFSMEYSLSVGLPLYEVRELTLEEALLVLASEKETLTAEATSKVREPVPVIPT